MWKTGRWIRSFLLGKKDKGKDSKDKENTTTTTTTTTAASTQTQNQPPEKPPSNPISISPATPKEKRRWSFRRSATKDCSPGDRRAENDEKMHAAAQSAAATVVRVTAAVRIQAAFRAYLARKALCALKGIVKLQAVARGELVRRQATATLRCMQAMLKLQARARAQRILMAGEGRPHRKSTQESRTRRHRFHEMDREMEETTEVVQMGLEEATETAKGRSSYSNHANTGLISAPYCPPNYTYQQQENYTPHSQFSPAPSALTDMSPRAYSGYLGDYFTTAQSSSQCYSELSRPRPDPAGSSTSYDHYSFFPNYMANTESSRAKARSHSAPKQRPVDSNSEKLPMIRRRPSVEGRNFARAMRMQRSSSHVGSSAAQNDQFPWSVRLDRSVISLKDSECGSTSSVLSNAAYCRTLVGFDLR